MTQDVLDHHDTFNTKGCPDELVFGNFNDQPVPSDYYNILNDDDDNDNDIPGTPVGDTLPDNEGVEYVVFPNDEVINSERITDYNDSLASDIDPLQN